MSAAKKLIALLKKEIPGESKISSTYLKLVQLFPIQPISTKEQHEVALNVIEKLITYMHTEKSSDHGVEIYLNTLSELVSDYERNKFISSPVHGSEMLSYLMELQQLNQSDLAKELGGQSVVSKILKGERELNLRQIKALSKRFKVSPEVFI